MLNSENKIEILLVDDSSDNLLAMEAVLSSKEYTLIKVDSGAAALRYLLEHDPSLILMDIQMPELDGFETAILIKRNERTRDIPIIFITAINKDEYHMLKGYEFGAVDYIHKPYDPQILRAKVGVFSELAKKTKRLLNAEKELREKERKERSLQIAQLELKSLKREQASQQKYIELVDGINHGIVWSVAPDNFSFSFVSKSAERILGYRLEEWTSQDGFLLNHIHVDDRVKFLDAILHLRNNQSVSKDIGVEHRVIAADGSEVWLHSEIRLTHKVDGEESELRGLSVDITKIKKAESILRRNKIRSDFLAEASLILSKSLDYETTLSQLGRIAVPKLADWYCIDMIDEVGEIKSFTLAHADISKIDEFGKIIARFPYVEDKQSGIHAALKTKRSQLYTKVSVEDLMKRARTEKELEDFKQLGIKSAMIVPLVIRDKSIGALTLISTEADHSYDENDLTTAESLAYRAALAIDNAILYKQAQTAIRTRDEFFSIASHELKTPLTPLKIQTQSLIRALSNGSLFSLELSKIEKMLKVSDWQVNKLSRLIDELLDASRVTIGKLDINLEEFNITELIQDIIDRFYPVETLRRDITFSNSGPVSVKWDRLRIEQVVINLLTNAIKYGMNRPVEVALSLKGENVTLTFRDQGIGIAKQDQERIFRRFERVNSEKHFSGLGLGLYISAQIIDAHCGKIGVESDVGKGSTFILELPRIARSIKNSSQKEKAGSRTNLVGNIRECS